MPLTEHLNADFGNLRNLQLMTKIVLHDLEQWHEAKMELNQKIEQLKSTKIELLAEEKKLKEQLSKQVSLQKLLKSISLSLGTSENLRSSLKAVRSVIQSKFHSLCSNCDEWSSKQFIRWSELVSDRIFQDYSNQFSKLFENEKNATIKVFIVQQMGIRRSTSDQCYVYIFLLKILFNLKSFWNRNIFVFSIAIFKFC